MPLSDAVSYLACSAGGFAATSDSPCYLRPGQGMARRPGESKVQILKFRVMRRVHPEKCFHSEGHRRTARLVQTIAQNY